MLSHIRVIDFTRLLPGPYATLRLADLGAQVLKIEEPSGDPARYVSGDIGISGFGPVFLANNRNKRSHVLDLKTTEGREMAWALASTADVVIESFRPGVADSLGIGYTQLREVRPDIVYCSLTGYGQSGPLSEFGGHDLNYMARSGVQSLITDTEGKPVIPGMQFADFIGGIVASEAILAALVERDKTGRGTCLDMSMTHALIGLLTNQALLLGKGVEDGIGVLSGKVVCYHLYPTKDQRSVSIAALEPKFWQSFCRFFDRPDWISRQMSLAEPENPTFREVEELFRKYSFAEWVDISEKLDACIAPVLSPTEALASKLAVSHGAVFTIDSEEWGPLLQVRTHAGGFVSMKSPDDAPPKLGDKQKPRRK
ncbi:CaiB/BaiF CoA transferase family protein [Alicyclobacillus mengziensis]|uniref:CoA transferase n=1 Tax=Alicyclobacillus mengziensis TaxID=2931921 RepID=A0A9X7W1B2_9BACL|nr:CoA transferase [Alicyclobacillus mengziensis]QSO48943.1 CoA transferase [Alicyclobacillus mengziensis]